jgi:glycine betaine/choline ABC-type transport system substrate-binding protein
MKKLYTILFALLVFAACTKDNTATTTQKKTLSYSTKDYNESLTLWAQYKASVKNTYTYTVLRSSFTGNNSETKITVVNGAVTKRDYIYYQYDMSTGTSTRVVLREWHETTGNLGSHTDEGAALLTIDDVYANAKNVWLKADPNTNDVYFEAKNDGLISTAGYVLKGCADDCFIGINIISVSSL